jgi:hypothetical protein
MDYLETARDLLDTFTTPLSFVTRSWPFSRFTDACMYYYYLLEAIIKLPYLVYLIVITILMLPIYAYRYITQFTFQDVFDFFYSWMPSLPRISPEIKTSQPLFIHTEETETEIEYEDEYGPSYPFGLEEYLPDWPVWLNKLLLVTCVCVIFYVLKTCAVYICKLNRLAIEYEQQEQAFEEFERRAARQRRARERELREQMRRAVMQSNRPRKDCSGETENKVKCPTCPKFFKQLHRHKCKATRG